MSFIEFKVNNFLHSNSQSKLISSEQPKLNNDIITSENSNDIIPDNSYEMSMHFRNSVTSQEDLYNLTNVELNTCVFCHEDNSCYIYMGNDPKLTSSWIIFSSDPYEVSPNPKKPVEVESKPKVEQLGRYGYIEI